MHSSFPERGSGSTSFNERRNKMEDLMRQAQRDAKASMPRPAADSNLRKLSDLHEAGILTDEEFETKKAQLQSSV